MSGTGVHYADLVAVPEKTHHVSDPDQHEKSYALDDGPTASHALATKEHEEKGFAETSHDLEVKDLGWNAPESKIPAPLVGGMDNEYLWMLVRRFNLQMYHVKEITTPVPGNLDLNIADEDEFSPDKLRSTIERLYMTVGISLIGFGKHVVRLRSWHEKKRTACFAGAYFVAWLFDLIMPLISVTLIALIMFPKVRSTMFPPAPLSLVDRKTGGLQKPPAGVLGSHDSATGAPENYKGEAVEQEASNFVTSIAHVALTSATGKHPQNPEEDSSAPADAAPDPSAIAFGGTNASISATGDVIAPNKDKTKQPMEAAIWNKMRPLMHGLQDLADTWERFANMLSATKPFPVEAPRLRLASLVVPLLAVSLITTSYLYMKGVTFGIGFGFFGDPVITRGLHWLNQTFPNWQKLLELRNTVLKGIPTNAQLTVTLLRVGEHNKAPLPPPPRNTGAPPDKAADLHDHHLSATGGDLALGASEQEIKEAIGHDPDAIHSIEDDDIAASKAHGHGKKGSKVLGLLKGGVAASVETAIGADRLKATAGSTAAKNRMGVLPKPNSDSTSGPIEFKSRYHGKKGYTYISVKATIPCVSFTTDHSVEKIGTESREDLHPVFSIAVADIKEMKKVGGFGWKTKLIVGWALDREVADGIEITDRKGNTYKITAMPLRDELFNRLIAMGGQKWESW